MSQLPIAELRPELSDRDSVHFRAAVTLIWPYSSSQRQFALLLAEPDFRLRRKKGQVRARFNGSTAKALATTGVGIGDEVIISLRGARFVQEGTVSTPGRSIDWELEYSQTVTVQVIRNGSQIANLELDNVAPTPAPSSPVRSIVIKETTEPSPAHQWSSPAFLKRVRLSDGPFFEAPYDSLAEPNGDKHDRKRRRKSYRDWKAWTYSARTPSPEKQGASELDESDELEASPTRDAPLPDTPVSQANRSRRGKDSTRREKESINSDRSTNSQKDDVVRDDVYYDLYAGPDEIPPSEAPYAFGGDTEVNTEEDDDMPDTDGDSTSSTEANTEDLASSPDGARDAAPTTSDDAQDAGSPTEEIDAHEVISIALAAQAEQPILQVEVPVVEILEDDGTTPVAVMAPPTLHSLNTDLHAQYTPGLLTPIGREPNSPTLQPLDSATLPLPSPFPGERGTEESHYLDQVPSSDQPIDFAETTVQEPELPSDADYIMENSFFSSISSSKTRGEHRDHETAFTPVRFAFGMDGAGWSRPLPASSPVPETIPKAAQGLLLGEDAVQDHMREHQDDDVEIAGLQEISEPLITSPDHEVEIPLADHAESPRPVSRGSTIEVITTSSQEAPQPEGEVIALSSDSEDDDSDNNGLLVEARADQDEPISTSGEANIFEQVDDEAGESLVPEMTANDNQVPSIVVEDEMSRPGQVQVEEQSDVEKKKMDVVPTPTDAVSSREQTPFAQVLVQPQEITSSFTVDEDFLDQSIFPEPIQDNIVLEAQPIVERSDPITDADDLPSRLADHHPDIKLESIEDDTPDQVGSIVQEQEREEDNDAAMSPDKMLIDIPSEGDHLGELHTITVPSTSPARNTRAKVRISISPLRDGIAAVPRVTRSTTSRPSAASSSQKTQTPPVRENSTLSPSLEQKQASPYSLRSQSKLLSPTKSTSIAATSPRRSKRRHVSQKSVESLKSDDYAQEAIPDEHDHEDDWRRLTDLSDPVEQEHEDTLKPPPLDASRVRTRSDSRGSVNGSQRRSATPTGREIAEIASPSPGIIRTTRNRVYSSSMEPSQTLEELKQQIVVQATEGEVEIITYPNLPLQGESNEMRSSSGLAHSNNQSFNHRSLADSNRLLTPEATQRTDQSRASQTNVEQAPQTLPMTPQLTQLSTGLRSFEDVNQSQTSLTSPRLTRRTPHRSVSITAIVFRSSSPLEATPSHDSDPETTQITKPADESPESVPTPTIGLSTPLAYYTPLSKIPYFLNRSSQFHTQSSPDILALVTSQTTQPTRAKSGPKHWNTTLHITDPSISPSQITVNLFRAYQSALPTADTGDVILLRAMSVKSLKRQPSLISADESAWCVWRYKKPVWGKKKGRGVWGDVRAREEVRGPEVERGEGEWREVGRIREWFLGKVRGEIEEGESDKVHMRVGDGKSDDGEDDVVHVEKRDEGRGTRHRYTRSRDKKGGEVEKDGEPVGDANEGRVLRHRHTRSQDKGKEKVVE